MANELDELEKFLNVTAGDMIENGISNGTKTVSRRVLLL